MRGRIFILSSGRGKIKRGFEAFSQDLSDKLEEANYDVFLAGGGESKARDLPIAHLNRSTYGAKALAFLLGIHPFSVQNITFFIGILPKLFHYKPSVLYLGEPVLYHCLSKWRKWTRQSFAMVFFTGGRTIPAPFDARDFVHLVTPELEKRATDTGISATHQIFLPHFLILNKEPHFLSSEQKQKEKVRLGIPEGVKVILSVGAIDKSVKRMDYLIEEFSMLEKKSFLVILGEQEFETPEIEELAQRLLPSNNFLILTVERSQVNPFYQIADAFCLASMDEGFGLVYIEACANGLPVLAHDFATSRWVLQNHGYFADLSEKGSLKHLLDRVLTEGTSEEQKMQRHRFVYQEYSWEVLKEQYLNLVSRVLKEA